MTVTNYAQLGPSGPWFNPEPYAVLFEVDGTAVAPTLQVTPIGQQIVLSWPSFATNYLLETSSSFGPGSAWTALTNGIVVEGNVFVLTNSPCAPAAFFRLRAAANSP